MVAYGLGRSYSKSYPSWKLPRIRLCSSPPLLRRPKQLTYDAQTPQL